jgi:hypothetical protein
MLNWAANAAAAMLTIMVPLQSNRKQGFRDTPAGGPTAIAERLLHHPNISRCALNAR